MIQVAIIVAGGLIKGVVINPSIKRQLFSLGLLLLSLMCVVILLLVLDISLIDNLFNLDLNSLSFEGNSYELDTGIESEYHSGTAPGKRCPTCKDAGRETWVFSGRTCPVCATYVP